MFDWFLHGDFMAIMDIMHLIAIGVSRPELHS